MPHAASMPCKLAGTQRLGHVYRVATLCYVLVGRCVAACTGCDVLRYTPPDLSSCLVSFASAEIVHSGTVVLRAFLQKKACRSESSTGHARRGPIDALPLWQTKKKLDTNTERVPTLLVTLSIRIIAGEGERRGKFRRTVSFAWRCRSPSGRAWQPREFSRPFAGCLCPRRRASEAMPSTLARHVWDRRFGVHTGDGGARANSVRTTAADSGQDEQRRRRSTTNRPSHLQAPSAFCSLACRALRLRDDETAGVVPWCDCASGQRLFRLSCRLHRRDDAACSHLRTTQCYTPLLAVAVPPNSG